MRRLSLAALLVLAAPLAAQNKREPDTPTSIVAAAPKSEWKAIAPGDLLVMTLAHDAAGNPRTVIIQLIAPPFSQGWVGNIRTLAKAHWWDGTSVYRVVDNWVTQWGDGEDDEAKAKKLPEGIVKVPESEYAALISNNKLRSEIGPPPALAARAQVLRDPYAPFSAWRLGWPIGLEPVNEARSRAWPVHCYGYVGVARDLVSTGTGAELYAVIGHAPRQLDRNIAVVGRVIEGIEHLSTLSRGKGPAGVYDDIKLRVPIIAVRLGTEMPVPPRFEFLNTESTSFSGYVRVSANRSDPFYKVAAGGIDICNAKVPIRRAP